MSKGNPQAQEWITPKKKKTARPTSVGRWLEQQKDIVSAILGDDVVALTARHRSLDPESAKNRKLGLNNNRDYVDVHFAAGMLLAQGQTKKMVPLLDAMERIQKKAGSQLPTKVSPKGAPQGSPTAALPGAQQPSQEPQQPPQAQQPQQPQQPQQLPQAQQPQQEPQQPPQVQPHQQEPQQPREPQQPPQAQPQQPQPPQAQQPQQQPAQAQQPQQPQPPQQLPQAQQFQPPQQQQQPPPTQKQAEANLLAAEALALLENEKSIGPKDREGFKKAVEFAKNSEDTKKLERYMEMVKEQAKKAARDKEEAEARENQVVNLSRSDKEQKALDALKERHEGTHTGITAALNGISEMVEGAQSAAKKARELADQANEEANKKAEEARKLGKETLEDKSDLEAAKKEAESAEQKAAEARSAANQARKDLDFALDLKPRLLHMVQFGPLSKTQDTNVQDAQAKILQQLKNHPEVAVDALGLVHKAKHPSEVANGVKIAGELAEKGFPHKEDGKLGDSTYPKSKSLIMARNALQLGGMLGHPYVDELKAFHENPPLPDHIKYKKEEKENIPQERARRGVAYTRDMANNLFVDGQVNFGETNANLTNTVNNLKFHPDSLIDPLFTVVESLEDMRGKFTGAEPNAYKDALSNVMAPSQEPTDKGAQTGRKLIGDALGLAKDNQGQPIVTITNLHAKQAVMSALLTPTAQGPVGSCFATGPVLKFREENTIDYIKDLTQIVGTGKLGRPLGRPPLEPIPVTSELPDSEGENSVARCHEYSVATLGSRVNGAEEKHTMMHSLAGLLRTFSNRTHRTKIEGQIEKTFDFVYLPEEQTGETAADSSSTKGKWVLMVGDTKITKKEDFFNEIKKAAKAALGNDAADNTELGKAIDVLCEPGTDENEVEVNNIMANYNGQDEDGTTGKNKSPWNMTSGGKSEGSMAVLFGNPPGTPLPTDSSKLPLLQKPAANAAVQDTDRAEDLLKKLVEGAEPRKKKVCVSVKGIHAMNLLPSHETLLDLKPAGNETTEDKIRTRLKEPGQKLAGKQPKETAAYLQNRAVEAFIGDFPESLRALPPPDAPKTPRELLDNLLAKVDGEIRVKFSGKRNKEALVAGDKKKLEEKFSAMLMKEMPPPEVVIDDTNYGGPTGHKFHVMAPDPLDDGKLKLWRKTEPGGDFTRESPDWLKKEWATLE